MLSQNEIAIETAQAWVDQHREAAEQAARELGDPAVLRAMLDECERIRVWAEAFQAADTPTKAVYLLARVELGLHTALTRVRTVRDFAAREAHLKRLKEDVPVIPGLSV